MEKWKKLKVIGPEAEVSNLGRVRRRGSCMGQLLKDWVLLNPYKDNKGLLFVTFRGDGKQQNRYVHKLVAANFVKNPNNFGFIRFKDNNQDNTSADNLEWTNHPKGYCNSGRGVILTEAAVAEIKFRLDRKEKQADIAADYKVHPSLISHIKARRKWK